nr:MAG TPA: hypothetical protein [Caudoviricetes sp.]
MCYIHGKCKNFHFFVTINSNILKLEFFRAPKIK